MFILIAEYVSDADEIRVRFPECLPSMIQLALYRPVDLVDKTVCFFTRGDYSHCSIILPDNQVVEAQPFKKVRLVDSVESERKVGSTIDIYDVDVTKEQEKIIFDFCIAQLGKAYDLPAVLGFVIGASREGRRSRQKWFCSELVFAAFEKAGILLLERTYHWKVSPVMLSLSDKIRLHKTIIVGR